MLLQSKNKKQKIYQKLVPCFSAFQFSQKRHGDLIKFYKINKMKE